MAFIIIIIIIIIIIWLLNPVPVNDEIFEGKDGVFITEKSLLAWCPRRR